MDISHEDRGRAARDAYAMFPTAAQRNRVTIARILRDIPAGTEQSLALGAACNGNRDTWTGEIRAQREGRVVVSHE